MPEPTPEPEAAQLVDGDDAPAGADSGQHVAPEVGPRWVPVDAQQRAPLGEVFLSVRGVQDVPAARHPIRVGGRHES